MVNKSIFFENFSSQAMEHFEKLLFEASEIFPGCLTNEIYFLLIKIIEIRSKPQLQKEF